MYGIRFVVENIYFIDYISLKPQRNHRFSTRLFPTPPHSILFYSISFHPHVHVMLKAKPIINIKNFGIA